MKVSFKEWLKLREVATSTAGVATYAMPLFGGGLFARQYPEMIGGRIIKPKKRKKSC